MKPVLLLVLICTLAACQTTAGHGLTPAWQQRVYTMNTQAACGSDPVVLRELDFALVAVARAADELGVAKYEAVVAALAGHQPGGCFLQKPEPCCWQGSCLPTKTEEITPRAGCSGPGWLWISAEYPAGTRVDWRDTLADEMTHTVASYVLKPDYPADHSGPWGAVYRRASQLLRLSLPLPPPASAPAGGAR